MSRLQRPYDSAFSAGLVLFFVAGIALAAATGYFGTAPRSIDALGPEMKAELTALPVTAAEMWKVERSWAPAPAADYITSPVIPPPCPAAARQSFFSSELAQALNGTDDAIERLSTIHAYHHEDLVAAVALGATLEQKRRFGGAEKVARDTLKVYGPTIRDLIADRKGKLHLGNIDAYSTKLLIHLYHIHGLALLSKQGSGANVYVPLRNAIGLTEDLDLHRLLGSVAGEGTSTITPIRIPGCDAMDGELTTGDLYNDLIVAYATRGYTSVDPQQRQNEITRPYADQPQVNPMQALLQRLIKSVSEEQWPAAREGKVWAVSNAERVVRANEGRPAHPLLALNIARLIEEVEPSVREPAGDEALRTLHDGLISVAINGVDSVANADRQRFANQLAIALPASHDDESKKAASSIAAMTTGQQAAVLSRLAFAAQSRSSLCQWFFTGQTPDQYAKLGSVLGAESSRWLKAARVDAAVSAARWGTKLGPKETEILYLRLRQMTRGWATPPEVETLGTSISTPTRIWLIIDASRTFWMVAGILAGLFVWLFFSWLLIEIRRAVAFHTSFYQVESEYVTRNEIERPAGVPGP